MHSGDTLRCRGFFHGRLTRPDPARPPVEVNLAVTFVVDPLGGTVRLLLGEQSLTITNPDTAARIRALLLNVEPPITPDRRGRD